MTATLHIISDIHLEKRKNPFKLCKQADILCLLGDIGNPFAQHYFSFLQDVSCLYSYVLLLTGNHEFHNDFSIAETENEIERLVQKLPNVTFLNNSSIYLAKHRFLGSTLWTDIPDAALTTVTAKMSDYRFCHLDASTFLTPEITRLWHSRNVQWIREQLTDSTPTIMLTHHAPIAISDNDVLSSCYGTDLTTLMQPPIRAWFYGHTHKPSYFSQNGVIVASNPVGYEFENLPENKNSIFML